jgi:hypothetical protein
MRDDTFKTADWDLALALATAGCTLEAQESGGPTLNVYTPDLLRNWGYIRGAVSIPDFEAVVTVCVHGGILPDGRKIRKRLGNVIFSFERNETFNRAHGEWDKCANEYMDARAQNREVNPRGSELTPEQIMQAAHGRRMNVERLNKLGWCNAPMCAIGGLQTREVPIESVNTLTKQKSHVGVTKTQGTGHMKQWTLGCSQEMRDRLKLEKSKPNRAHADNERSH